MKYIFFTILILISINVFSQNVGQKGDTLKNYKDINGLKQGYWEKPYKNGRIAYKAYFVNDKLVGDYFRYYSNGKQMLKIKYDKNQSGYATLYWDNGKKMAEGKYVNVNVKDSIWKFYGIDGVLMATESYKNGIRDGLAQSFYRNKKVSEEIGWKNGKKNGIWRKYYDNGQTRMETRYVNNEMDGIFHVFYQNGRMYIDGGYKADLKHGVWNFYDKKGKLEKTIEYINGIATNQDELDSIQDAQIREWESQKGKFKEPDVNRFYNPQR
jgi:antitoxin component YwqK of YwqJK toxin-antitoxin module